MFPLLPRGVNSEAVIYACCLSQFEQVLHKWHTHSLTYLCEMSAAFRNNEAVNFPNYWTKHQCASCCDVTTSNSWKPFFLSILTH